MTPTRINVHTYDIYFPSRNLYSHHFSSLNLFSSGNHLFLLCIYKCVSVLLYLSISLFLDSSCKWTHEIFIFLWLLSLSIPLVHPGYHKWQDFIFFMTNIHTGESNGTRSSTPAWQIPWTEEPGGLPSMGSLRVGVTEGRTRLSDFTFTFHFHALEKEMATHSSVLAWRIPGMGEPGGLPSMGSHRVRHHWSDLAAAAELFPDL